MQQYLRKFYSEFIHHSGRQNINADSYHDHHLGRMETDSCDTFKVNRSPLLGLGNTERIQTQATDGETFLLYQAVCDNMERTFETEIRGKCWELKWSRKLG